MENEKNTMTEDRGRLKKMIAVRFRFADSSQPHGTCQNGDNLLLSIGMNFITDGGYK